MKITKRPSTARVSASIDRAPKITSTSSAVATLGLTPDQELSVAQLKSSMKRLALATESTRLSQAFRAFNSVSAANMEQHKFTVLEAYKTFDDMLHHGNLGISKQGSKFIIRSGEDKQAFYTKRIANAIKRYSTLNSK